MKYVQSFCWSYAEIRELFGYEHSFIELHWKLQVHLDILDLLISVIHTSFIW